jgi:hypothetical protein
MIHDPRVTLSHNDSAAFRELVIQALKADPEKVNDVDAWKRFMNEVDQCCEALADDAFKAGYELGIKR